MNHAERHALRMEGAPALLAELRKKSMRPTKYTVDQHLWGCVGYFALLAA
jgi:hypothetical protein